MTDTRDIDPAGILAWMRECFDVYPEQGILYWRNPPSNHAGLLNKSAGSVRKGRAGKNYHGIKRNGRVFKRGWLIFLWDNGRWPSHLLDHEDGNSLNDSIGNLREATVIQNAWNHKTRAKQSPLPMGVRMEDSGRFRARIAFHKTTIDLGTYHTPHEAREVYLSKRRELYHEFA